MGHGRILNDFTSTPDQLLGLVLAERPSGKTDFSEALAATRAIMEQHWSTERFVICGILPFDLMFKSFFTTQNAGHDFPFRPVGDEVIEGVCRSAVDLG
jgi:hypothetical protein